MPVLTKINTNSIAEDAITGDKWAGDAYLSNTANQNISGTYSENRLYTSDAYTLSANATVNSHLTLSTIKSTGDVVLTKINIATVGQVDGADSSVIRLTVQPASNDVVPVRNQILEIDSVNMSVTGVADTIAAGSSDAGVNYTTTARY